jgi:uncharacterized protein
MADDIKHESTDQGGSFFYVHEGAQVGEMHYFISDKNVITIDHTIVDESMEGHGIGKKLLESLVAYVREKNLKVIPKCSFAHVTFKRMNEWQDVLLH